MKTLLPPESVMTFIGAGNMAEALVRGIVMSKLVAPSRVRVTDPERSRRDHFRKAFGVNGFEDNAEGIKGARVVLLAVKPQVLPAVAPEIAKALSPGTLVISIAAGISTQRLARFFPRGTRIVRVMPNMPALAGAGVSVYSPGRRATASDAKKVESIFKSVGIVLRLPEKQLDAVTALSGSGPAYVFFLAECMIQAGCNMGLDAATARKLTLGTIAGASKLLAETGQEPAELRQRVTSRGGTTAAAMDVLEHANVKQAMIKAIEMARERSRELSVAKE